MNIDEAMSKILPILQDLDAAQIDPLPGDVDPPAESSWFDALQNVDWSAVSDGMANRSIQTRGEFFSAVADELLLIADIVQSLQVTGLVSFLVGISRWCEFKSVQYAEIKESFWIDCIRDWARYMKFEALEPDRAATFPEACEGIAFVLQSNLSKHVYEWQSDFEYQGRPVSMQQVVWYLSYLLYMVPKWFGEGIRMGEEYLPETPGSKGGADVSTA